jgi:hypothetical protein
MSFGPGASAAPVSQYATTVIARSSVFNPGPWRANQATGASNTIFYGDYPTAWAPLPENGDPESITVGFGTSVYANGATIRETFGNGFVFQIDALDTNGVLHTVWTGTDTSAQGVAYDFSVSWTETAYLVNGLKVYVDINTSASWEEIDSIMLSGVTDPTATDTAVPEPASIALFAMGLGLLGWRRRAR